VSDGDKIPAAAAGDFTLYCCNEKMQPNEGVIRERPYLSIFVPCRCLRCGRIVTAEIPVDAATLKAALAEQNREGAATLSPAPPRRK
jgi:hypothetical protein